MNNIEKLVAELCPDGVGYDELGKISNIYKGIQLNKTKFVANGKYPILNGGRNPSGFYNDYNTESHTITISEGGVSAGYVNFMLERFWASGHCYVLQPDSTLVSNRFLYFILKNNQNKLMNLKQGAGIPNIRKNRLSTFKIPTPP